MGSPATEANGPAPAGTRRATPVSSVARLFRDRVAASPDVEAYRFPRDGGWTSMTWRETQATVDVLAAGLLAMGIGPEDRVGIASGTRIEWIHADLATMCAGGATTAVYPTSGADDIGFILADSGSRVVFAEDDVQVAKLRAQRDRLPDVLRVVTFDGTADGDWVIGLDDLAALGADHLARTPTAVDEAVAAVGPEQLATLIYTSGTTGRPKGVELPHRCWTYIAGAADALDILGPDDLQYLWLPLAHAFGKMLEAAQLQVGFPTVVDGRVDQIVANLPVIRPTFMAGPPRIFEKVHAAVEQTVEAEGGIRLRLYRWSFEVGGRAWRARLDGRRVGPLLQVQQAVADRLVLSRIRARLGGRMRFLVSGSAALSSDVSTWFGTAGMPILEGYGLTETAGGACLGDLARPVPGLVGAPVVGTEVRIAEDGEILIRGPLVMRGYHHRPDATAEALSSDGWFRTGDVGELDAEGRLRVTDRKKDLIKTSGGKYIAPQGIESLFKAICPLASQMVVHGEGRHYATALIALDAEALARWAAAEGRATTDYPSLAADAAVHDLVRGCVAELNDRLNRWETIKDFRILDHDLTVEGGELTPSMKLKRKTVEASYAALLDSMYETRRAATG
ncbi:long-chain acyl-CoA synthetase [Blastococcus aggregatus]|uniref:Long-chain acyl-CoA synthetase n=1 Tax=Blastococcus aggregatus TaxID=38502 RepID=A0A285V6I3_9ACTN|nr:long-chain fatty acid--CoA ligase [Blastococcus aggregatus]SOC49537.1 long-chain acyl-CoA synthetase [Blastococcus aggregatus]